MPSTARTGRSSQRAPGTTGSTPRRKAARRPSKRRDETSTGRSRRQPGTGRGKESSAGRAARRAKERTRSPRARGWIDRALAVVERARGEDLLMMAAGLAFYALVSIVPLAMLTVWIASLVVGDDRVRTLSEAIATMAPDNIGADKMVQRVAEIGTRLGLAALVAGAWPASSYGAGLIRAFDRLSPKGPSRDLKGIRGRGLLILALLPILVVGTLVTSSAGTHALGSGGLAAAAGWVIALVAGFVTAGAALVVIYKLFPPESLGWSRVLQATAAAAAGIALLSLVIAAYARIGANFEEHYAVSSLAGIVLIAVWLFVSNALILGAYQAAAETRRT